MYDPKYDNYHTTHHGERETKLATMQTTKTSQAKSGNFANDSGTLRRYGGGGGKPPWPQVYLFKHDELQAVGDIQCAT